MFFVGLFIIIIFLFNKAFSTYFFTDDFFFLKISRITNISDFIKFFSPIRTHSYKPLATEVFYWLIHLVNHNLLISHGIVFIVFFIGLVYLYKNIMKLTNNRLLAYLTTGLYGISFTHVFQLYYLATFQEIAVFTCLNISFYYFQSNFIIL